MVICYILGCKSRSERKSENITFHTFPKDPATRQLWIRATGRRNWEPTKYTRICSRHFEQKCFRKTARNITYLNVFSIPTLHITEHEIQAPLPTSHKMIVDATSEPTTSSEIQAPLPTSHKMILDATSEPTTNLDIQAPLPTSNEMVKESKFDVTSKPTTSFGVHDEPSCSFINIDESDMENKPINPLRSQSVKRNFYSMESANSNSTRKLKTMRRTEEELTPRKKKLVSKLKQTVLVAETRKKKLAALRSKCHRLEKKNAELSEIIEKLQSKNLINQEAADFLTSNNSEHQGLLKSSKNKYSPEIRKFALNLHFISPRAYNFVRKTFNTCLPHARTLARWYQTIEGEPGFSTEAFVCLKALVKNSPSRKWVCGLCFDEMAIRQFIEWNGKSYVGFVDCGDRFEGDSLPVAKEALVFMLTCLNGSWKIPVGYFLVNGVTAEQKAAMAKTCIDLITACDIDVVALTFDGCPANFSMAKLLGCRIASENINPVFSHNGKKIVVFPDPSHMLKLVRNTLGEKTSLADGDGRTVSWFYITALVDLQENEGLHLANKIRYSHVEFKKQIMKVKLAAQTFSESVADAIEYCNVNLKLEMFQNSEATVDFIRKFNSLFDILNSRNLNAYGYKKPLKPQNYEQISIFLEEVYVYIKNLKIGTTPILESNRKTGFLGMCMCIRSLLFLYESLVKRDKLDFISAYKLSQDHLEIFFSAIRAKGGFNNNPTASQFKAAYKRLLVHGEIKHLTSGNCVPLSDIHILTYSKPEVAINDSTDRGRLIDDDEFRQQYETEIVVSKDHDYVADPTRITEYSRQVVTYIAGFVINSLKNQIKCEQCLSVLRSSEKIEDSLILKKDKGGLCYPSKPVIKLCEIAELVYRKNKLSYKKDTMHHLLQECLKMCMGSNQFTELVHDYGERSIFDSHFSLLLKSICKKYLNTRIHYATKHLNKKEENVRNFYTKLILFKGQ